MTRTIKTLISSLLLLTPLSHLHASSVCSILLTEQGLKMAGYNVELRPARAEDVAPAERFLKEKLAEAIENENWNSLFEGMNAANEQLAGAFQASFYDGQPYLTYTEKGQSYFVYKNRIGQWSFATGLHPVESLIERRGKEKEIMEKRFKTPPGMVLVGLETNAIGSIIPIFSTSPNLTFFRDLESAQGGFMSMFSNLQSASPRTAKVVPLVKLKTVNFIGGSDKNLEQLPIEIQALLKNGETLTTTFSTAYTDPQFVDVSPTEYSVLVITDNARLGRTGIILKNGIPLLTQKDGQEYFLEIKGIGLANPLSGSNGITQERGEEGNVRTGRIPVHYAENELIGFNLTIQNVQQNVNLQKLYARSVVGVAIPEYESHFNYDGKQLASWDQVRAASAEGNLSGQIFRLATSTRRVAFADNPVFGGRYTSRQDLLRMSQQYYGKILGDLLVRESSPSIHRSPHPENFVYFPIQKALTHTDYADMEEGYELGRFLSDLAKYHVFSGEKGTEGTNHFYAGLRSSLEPRGLWTARLARFVIQSKTLEEFENFIYYEFIFPYKLKAALEDRENRHPPFPGIGEFNDTWLGDIKKNDRKDLEGLEIQFRHIDRDIKGSLKAFRYGIFISTLGKLYFKDFHPTLQLLIEQLSTLSAEASALYKQGEKENWRRPIKFYVIKAKDIFSREAAIYDSIYETFGFRSDNRGVLKKMEIFKP